MTDACVEVTFARTKTWQILQALSSDVTVTVACLIKGRDEEADSYGAAGQKVSRLTGPWNVKEKKFSALPHLN